MKCAIVDASGHPGGHTGAACIRMSKVLEGAGWEVDYLTVPVSGSSHCNGCGSCSSTGRCILADPMSSAVERICASDILILASPIRFSGLSSQMKMLIDRMNPLWHVRQKVPRWVCWVLCGGSPEPKFTNARSELTALALGIGSECGGYLEISGTDSDGVTGTANAAGDFAADIVARLSTLR